MKTPLQLGPNGVDIRDADGDPIISVPYGADPEAAEQIAQRFVACVNTCASISDAELSQGLLALSEILKVFEQMLRQDVSAIRLAEAKNMARKQRNQLLAVHNMVRKQRNQLLAVLGRFAAFDGKYGGGEPMDATDYEFNVKNLQAEARATIANVQADSKLPIFLRRQAD